MGESILPYLNVFLGIYFMLYPFGTTIYFVFNTYNFYSPSLIYFLSLNVLENLRRNDVYRQDRLFLSFLFSRMFCLFSSLISSYSFSNLFNFRLLPLL